MTQNFLVSEERVGHFEVPVRFLAELLVDLSDEIPNKDFGILVTASYHISQELI